MKINSISKNLIYQRKLKGYTQEELSDRTQVTVRTIQRIEKGDVQPHLQTVKLLASALEVEVADLLPLEDPKEENIQKKWLILIHGTPLIGMVLPFFNILLPIFLWIHKRQDNKIYDRHGRAVINFQITVTIAFFLGFLALLTVEKFGFLFFASVIPFCIIVILANIVSVLRTNKFYYPLSIPFLSTKRLKPSSPAIVVITILLISLGSYNSAFSQNVPRLDNSVVAEDVLSKRIEDLRKAGDVHGLAVVIFDQNKAVYSRNFGYKNQEKELPITDSTNMYGGSLSKAVFGVLVMKLVEENLIDLDTPLENYLPKKIYEYEPQAQWHDDFTDLKQDSLYHKITARMCLAHTTGFTNWVEPGEKLKVKFEPGTKYSYSGMGITYLQVVLEKMLGKNIKDIAHEKIFVPLKMHNTSYEYKPKFDRDFAYGHSEKGKLWKKDKDNEPRAASTLETTVKDYTIFLEAVLQNKIISRQSREELFSPQIRIHSVAQFPPLSEQVTDKYDPIELSYGLGWGIFQTPYGYGAFKECRGIGFIHYSVLFPQTGKGVLLMSNSDNAAGIYRELLEITMANTYTPWEWENYIPYDQK